MLESLISHNPDIKKLYTQGYEVGLFEDHLVINNVPYVCGNKTVKRGKLVSQHVIHVSDKSIKPNDHTVYFSGDQPCDNYGNCLNQIINKKMNEQPIVGMVVNYYFSSKPPEGFYKDYFHKMDTYVKILENYAKEIDPSVTAKNINNTGIIDVNEINSVFKYPDSASSKAKITAISNKLKLNKIAIIGLGGTGSYILDLVAKTPVREIHLFDDDVFDYHNAFRIPGAASIEIIERKITKVEYLTEIYTSMRNGIVPHIMKIGESNVTELDGMDFVFISVDSGSAKLPIIEKLESMDVPFIDVGMDVTTVDGSLRGIVRVTTSTKNMRVHIHQNNRIGFSDVEYDNVYNQNIQTSDLNALNATLAVIKWKKLCGFYQDFERECNSVYTLDGNIIANGDCEKSEMNDGEDS